MRFPWQCVLAVGALMAGLLLVAACGGGGEEEAAPTATSSPVPSLTARPTATAGTSETATAGTTVTPTSRVGPEREVPPSAVLRAGDVRQTGALGTFTWNGFHSDAFAIVVPTEPIAVASGEPLVLQFAFDPTELRIAAWRADQGEVVWGPSDVAFSWRPARFEESVLEETPPPGRTIELRPDLPPGTYIVNVYARAAAGGDAYYGFHIEIVP